MPSPDPHSALKFIADCHLGRVAKYLRILGYDTLYFPHIDDNDLIKLSNAEDRIILTRDKILSERKGANVYLLKPTEIKAQLADLFKAFGLSKDAYSFSRCTVDNTPLIPVEKDKIIDRLPEGVKKHFELFELCPACKRIYWKGDHYHNMLSLLEEL